jgi:hypothetical protein
MTFQKATIASLVTLGLGALATGAALVQAAGFSALLSGICLWALSPYAVFCCACFLARNSRGEAIATFVVCALATAYAIFWYGDLIFFHPDSSGLVFVLVPIYQLPAAIVLLVVLFFTRPRSRSSATPNKALERTNSAE